MLKNIYFTNFDSKKDDPIIKPLISLDNIAGLPRSANIYTVNMKNYFKKDDVIEIDCKLMFQHSVYTYADKNIYIMIYMMETNNYLEKPVVIINLY